MWGINYTIINKMFFLFSLSFNRLRGSRVLLAGLGGLGAEVAKNLILAGVKGLTLLDHEQVLNVCTHQRSSEALWYHIPNHDYATKAESLLNEATAFICSVAQPQRDQSTFHSNHILSMCYFRYQRSLAELSSWFLWLLRGRTEPRLPWREPRTLTPWWRSMQTQTKLKTSQMIFFCSLMPWVLSTMTVDSVS